MRRRISRRGFLSGLAGGWVILRRSESAYGSPAAGRLNIALVGVGGRGRWFVGCIPKLGQNVVAMCDVNDRKAAQSYKRIPKARKFYDYRRMLDRMGDQIDAVVVAVPDHSHAPATALALRCGKHVLCEKPLTWSIGEARRIRELARKAGVATQMGNQGTASPAYRRAWELIEDGALGTIRQIHVWNTGGGPGKRPLPKGSMPIPSYLKWDLWLGPAAFRPYNERWLRWHGWREFGTGVLGNWASHTMNLPFRALKIDSLWAKPAARIRVKAETNELCRYSFPRWEVIKYEIPARGDLPPLTLTWHNGPGRAPRCRELVEKKIGRKLDWGDAGERRWRDHAGCIIIGTKATLLANAHNTVFEIAPKDAVPNAAGPPRRIPRSRGHEMEWIADCLGGPKAFSNFEYASKLTEFVLLGNMATRFNRPLTYEPASGKFPGDSEAEQFLMRTYRQGWKL